MKPIDWSVVGNAVSYYKGLGYGYVEVPWLVSREAVRVTLPKEKRAFDTHAGTLVGSAEQSFIQMMMDRKLPPGRHCAVSPCFRDDGCDELHQTAFMKVEIIWIPDGPFDATRAVRTVAEDALGFMRTYARNSYVTRTDEGLDIEVDGIELGSYGFRTSDRHGLSWVYGTGVAEPRLSSTVAVMRPGSNQ